MFNVDEHKQKSSGEQLKPENIPGTMESWIRIVSEETAAPGGFQLGLLVLRRYPGADVVICEMTRLCSSIEAVYATVKKNQTGKVQTL